MKERENGRNREWQKEKTFEEILLERGNGRRENNTKRE